LRDGPTAAGVLLLFFPNLELLAEFTSDEFKSSLFVVDSTFGAFCTCSKRFLSSDGVMFSHRDCLFSVPRRPVLDFKSDEAAVLSVRNCLLPSDPRAKFESWRGLMESTLFDLEDDVGASFLTIPKSDRT
jgi:hypothetical protein